MDFTGWAYIDQLIDPKRSRVVDTSTGGGYVWNGASVDKAPLRLVGVAVAFNSRPLFLTERRAKRQSIRFRDVSTSDFASTNDKERKQP